MDISHLPASVQRRILGMVMLEQEAGEDTDALGSIIKEADDTGAPESIRAEAPRDAGTSTHSIPGLPKGSSHLHVVDPNITQPRSDKTESLNEVDKAFGSVHPPRKQGKEGMKEIWGESGDPQTKDPSPQTYHHLSSVPLEVGSSEAVTSSSSPEPLENPGGPSSMPASPRLEPSTLQGRGNQSFNGANTKSHFVLPSLESGLAVVDRFLVPEEVESARSSAEIILKERGRQAGLGGGLKPLAWKDAQARGDTVCWLHLKEEQEQEQYAIVRLLERINLLKDDLEQQGYPVVGGSTTYQLACYPGGGARYVRHSDATKISCPSRCITAICYLNADWDDKRDGGQLHVYNKLEDTPSVLSPLGGRLVVFESRIEHEVLPTYKSRYAFTAWFHRRPPTAEPAPLTPPCVRAQPESVPAKTSAAVTSPTADPALLPPPVDEEASACVLPVVPSLSMMPPQHDATSARHLSMPPQHATSARPSQGVSPPPRERIFVGIAAYRDPECQWTIHDLLSKATHPESIRVGVVWQVDAVQDSAFVRVAGTKANPHWLKQIREIRIPWEEATGPCKARKLTQQLWSGEEYVLQIDSHMRNAASAVTGALSPPSGQAANPSLILGCWIQLQQT
eukprot:gene21623-28626_t